MTGSTGETSRRLFECGRVALVTGGSRGIGRACAIALAKAGADVAVTFRTDQVGANEVVSEICELGQRALAYNVSFEDENQVNCVTAKVVRDFGSLSILINNVGVGGPGRSVQETEVEELRSALSINALAPFILSKYAIPHLRHHVRSDIVFISSVVTRTLLPNAAAYAMSKAAVQALALVLAKEEGPHGIRCNVVAPGLTDTDMGRAVALRRMAVSNIRELDDKSPFGHVCQPEDVASAVLYFVSDGNSYGNGQVLYIDGGL